MKHAEEQFAAIAILTTLMSRWPKQMVTFSRYNGSIDISIHVEENDPQDTEIYEKVNEMAIPVAGAKVDINHLSAHDTNVYTIEIPLYE